MMKHPRCCRHGFPFLLRYWACGIACPGPNLPYLSGKRGRPPVSQIKISNPQFAISSSRCVFSSPRRRKENIGRSRSTRNLCGFNLKDLVFETGKKQNCYQEGNISFPSFHNFNFPKNAREINTVARRNLPRLRENVSFFFYLCVWETRVRGHFSKNGGGSTESTFSLY